MQLTCTWSHEQGCVSLPLVPIYGPSCFLLIISSVSPSRVSWLCSRCPLLVLSIYSVFFPMFPVGCYTCLFHALCVLPAVWDPLKFVILRSWFSCFLVLRHRRSLTEQPNETKSERSLFFSPFVFNFFHLFYFFHWWKSPLVSSPYPAEISLSMSMPRNSTGWRGHQSSVLAWGQLPSPCGPPRHHRTELERGVCLRSVRARARTSPSSAALPTCRLRGSLLQSPVREPQSPAAINHNNVYTFTNDYINCQFVVLHTCTQTLFHTLHIREMQEIFRRAHNNKRQYVI